MNEVLKSIDNGSFKEILVVQGVNFIYIQLIKKNKDFPVV